jgi:serine/threonine-protein kinase
MSEAKRTPESPVADEPAVRFSDLWRKGQKPDVQSFLRDAGTLKPADIVAVLCVDQWERWQAGERVPAETHLQMAPAVIGTEAAFDLVYGEFLLREEMGESPTREEYLKRFPQYAPQITRQFELHRVLESGFGSPSSVVTGPAPHTRTTNTPESMVVYGKSPAALAPGERDRPSIPGYEIFGEIGRGGMGVVWKAKHARLNRVCALKVIHKDRLSQNPEAAKRFQREAQAAAQLHHSNVVVVYDFDHVGDTCFIAMEYVEGIDLHQLVKDSGPLNVEQACDYVRQTALGLQHAFERGLVHRDIKPSNLLVTMPKQQGISGFHLLPVLPGKSSPPASAATPPATPATPPTTGSKPTRPLGLSYMGTHQIGVVKILDMGLALLTHAQDTSSSQWTQEGTLMGTPDFIAPEQAMNSHAVDIRADLYSLGCTLYFLLTGRAPFGEYPLIKKLMMHQATDPRPVQELRPEVPAAVAAIVRKLIAKAPQDRYQTPEELVQALAHWKTAGPGPVPTVPTSPSATATSVSSPKPPPAKVPYIPPPIAKPRRKEVELPPGVTKAQKIAILEGHRGSVTSVAFSPNRSTLASGGVDGGLRLWDLAGTEPRDRAVPGAHASDVNALIFAADNESLASGAGTLDGTVWLWNTGGEQPQQLACINTQQATVDTLAFSPDHALLAGGGSDRHVRVWDLTAPMPVLRTTLKGHTDYVKSLVFAAAGQTIISGSQDGTVRIWNLTKFWSKEQAVIQGKWGSVLTLGLSPDERMVVFGCLDQTVRLWDLTGPAPTDCGVLRGHLGIVRLVQFNPDGQTVLSVCDGGRVILWDVGTLAKQREWMLPRSKIYSVTFTTDGRYIATGNSDGSVFLFRLYPRSDGQASGSLPQVVPPVPEPDKGKPS